MVAVAARRTRAPHRARGARKIGRLPASKTAPTGQVQLASLAGQQVDKYDMVEEVGHGGMAVVYRGRDTMLDREVAIKVLHAHLSDREESRQRLRREAITVAKLRHENIVEIFDYSGEDADSSYIVTEFIHGVTLREWLDTRWSPRPALAALIVHRLCIALQHAHEYGVVHRDIKPENVMIREDGCLKLMDFGIAQIIDHQKLTMTGQLLGSPAYMAPELISGKPVDNRTDLFSVGIMLYQLATGQLPFSGRNPHEVLNRIADAEYTPPSKVLPVVDGELEAIIAKALARTPEERYQSAQALANELEDYLAGVGLEPSVDELEAYFADAETYVDELDQRVCAHLMDRAESASRDGHNARALKLLARVLELAPDNRRASSMLESVKLRGQRMRQLLVVGGAVAMLGLIAAGVLLLRPEPPEPRKIATEDATTQTTAGSRTSAYIPPADEDGSGSPPSDDAGSGAGLVSGETGEVGGDTGGDTGQPAVANDGGTKPPRKPIPRKGFRCSVTVTGIPAAQVDFYGLRVGKGSTTKLDSESKSASLELPPDGSYVSLVGPKGSARYTGGSQINAERCKGGKYSLSVQPNPARIKFNDLPADVDRLVVSCVKGCDEAGAFWQKFKVPLDANEDSINVTLRLQAPGYEIKDKSYRLQPGMNTLSAKLQKAD